MILKIKECKQCGNNKNCQFKNDLKTYLSAMKGEYNRVYLTHKCKKVVPKFKPGQLVQFSIAYGAVISYNYRLVKKLYIGRYTPVNHSLYGTEGFEEFHESTNSYRIHISPKDAQEIKSYSNKLDEMTYKDDNSGEYYFTSLWKYVSALPTTHFNIRR